MTHDGAAYHFERLRHAPLPAVRPLPIMIGGSGEKKTLRLVARYADACNLFDQDHLPRKLEVLREHCEREGRDYAEIEKTALGYLTPGNPSVDQAVDVAGRLAETGIDHVIFSQSTGQDVAGLLGEARAQVEKIIPAGR